MNKSESKYFNTALRFDQALLSLLEEKPFAYITVKELCQKAGVNRSTFYLHYENTADLLQETTRYVLDQFLSYFPNKQELSADNVWTAPLEELNYTTDTYLLPYLSYINENQKIFTAVLSHPSIFHFQDLFQQLFDHIFDPILDRFRYPEDERKYVMMFYLNGLTAIVTQWLEEGCQKSTEEVSLIIRHCIFGWEV